VSPNYRGEAYALSMHSEIFRRIADREPGYVYTSPTRFGNMFKKFLLDYGYELENDKVTINVAGKNFASFDLQFLNKQTDLSKHVKIRHKILDPAILFVKPSDYVLPGLSECKKRAKMPEHVAHDAISDAKDVVGLIREGLGHKFL
jgi:oligoribonuclease